MSIKKKKASNGTTPPVTPTMMSPIVTLTDDGDESSRMQVLLQAIQTIVNGDFSIRLDFSRDQVMTKIAEAYNDVANLNGRVTDEFIRISEVVGREGNMTERASVTNPVSYTHLTLPTNREV